MKPVMALAEEQIKAAFEQSEKEVNDLHTRISQGMREAKNKGAQIGLPKGTKLITKKSLACKAIIQKHSKDFGGSLEDPDGIKLCGCSRNSYYKYKREIKHIYIWTDSIAQFFFLEDHKSYRAQSKEKNDSHGA